MEIDYTSFTARDFVLDDSFRQWVLNPNETAMSFWHTYMLRHPEQQETIDEAASILLHLRTTYHNLGEASQQRIWDVLNEAFDAKETRRMGRFLISKPKQTPAFRKWSYRWVASAFLAVAGGGYWFYTQQPHEVSVKTNFGEERVVTLPDNSTVVLGALNIDRRPELCAALRAMSSC